MLYHLEVLVGLFAVLGCMKAAEFGFLMQTEWHVSEGITMFLAVCLAARTTYEISLPAIVTLLLLANLALELLRLVFGIIIPRLLFPLSPDMSNQLSRIRYFSLGLCLLLLGLQCVGKLFRWNCRFCLSVLCTIYIATINTAMVLTSENLDKLGHSTMSPATRTQRQGTRLLTFTSTFFLVAPSIVAAKIVALLSTRTLTGLGGREIPEELLPSMGLNTITIRLLLPIFLRLVWLHYQQNESTSTLVGRATKAKQVGGKGELLRSCLFGFFILNFGPSVFQMGESFRSGDLMAAVSWIECLCLPFAS